MAIFSPGSIVASLHGSLGGVTFRSSKHSNVVSLKPRPSQPNSVPQLEQRQLFALALHLWLSDLTPADRLEWRAIARTMSTSHHTATSRTLSGRNLFFRQYLVPWPTVLESLYPEDALLRRPLTGVTLDFTSGGPYNVIFSSAPPPLPGAIYIDGVRHLPTPQRTAHETWTPVLFLSHPAGTFDLHPAWLFHLGEMPPGENFVLGLSYRAKEYWRRPLTRFYSTVHA